MDDYFQFTDPAQAQRAEIVRLNKRRSAFIISEHQDEGASEKAYFVSSQLPPLDTSRRPYDVNEKTCISVVNADSFVAARELMKEVGTDASRSTAVLNMASDEYPGGGYDSLCIAQEEALCYTSTLFHTLLSLQKHYPWPNKGPDSIKGIFSPGVVIFRQPLHDATTNFFCAELPPSEQKVVSVISVAAPRYPALTEDGYDFKNETDRDNLCEKVRLILRMAGWNGQKYLIVGALGCGAYRCPPQAVARVMKSVLEEPEFCGWFGRIIFAVYSSPGVGWGNYDIFRKIFEGDPAVHAV